MQREDCSGVFQKKKIFNDAEEIASLMCAISTLLFLVAGNASQQLQNTPVKSRRGTGLRVYASSFSGGRILERGNLLCAGYVWSLDHRTRQFLISWLRVKIKAKGTGVRSVLSWSVDHRTRQFVMCWLRVATRSYSLWLRVAGYA